MDGQSRIGVTPEIMFWMNKKPRKAKKVYGRVTLQCLGFGGGITTKNIKLGYLPF